MTSSKRSSSVTPTKSRLARTFDKVWNFRAATGVTPEDESIKSKSGELKYNLVKQFRSGELKDRLVKKFHSGELKNSLAKKFESSFEEEEEKLKEAFLAKVFASISAIKAGYGLLQQAQSPYDTEGIQSADDMIVSEMKKLSELKRCFQKQQFDDENLPEITQLLAECQEQKSLLSTYESIKKKYESQLKLKDSEITFLRETLEEANKEIKSLEKRSSASGSLSAQDNLTFEAMDPSHFAYFLKHTVKSIHAFARLLSSEMEQAGWDLDTAASAIQPGFTHHRSFAFESFVSREIFDGFNHPFFSKSKASSQPKQRRDFFRRFTELKSVKATDYLASKPNSMFGRFCRTKYPRLVHFNLEESLFGNSDQRNLIDSGKFPVTPFFASFANLAKRVWLLHCLAFAFSPEAKIFQVSKGSRFSELYMEGVNDEAFIVSSDDSEELHVGFTVVPGFEIGKTVVQCQVYLH